jgi:hypothetical protein
VAQHVRVDRKGESGATADALDEAVDGIRRERATALGGEDKGRIRGLPAQLAQGSHLVASQRGRHGAAAGSQQGVRMLQSCTNVFEPGKLAGDDPRPRQVLERLAMYDPDDDVRPDTPQSGEDLQRGVAQGMVRGSLVLRTSLALPVDMRPLRGRDLAALRPGEQRQRKTGGGMRPDLPCPLGGCDAVSDLGDLRLVQEALDFALAIALDPLGRIARES